MATEMPAANKNAVYDFAIGGGGMVGCCAAIILARAGFNIALIEAVEPQSDISPAFDQRAIALSYTSIQILKNAGIWPALEPLAEPIKQIHVSDRGHFGFTRLRAQDYALDAMGQVIALEEAGVPLWKLVATESKIDSFCPAEVCAVTQTDDMLDITLKAKDDSTSSISAKLLLAADGTFSHIAKRVGIEYQRASYQQHAIIANLQFSEGLNGRAFERFTANGPLALLPLSRNRVSLVWCHQPDDCERLMALTDREFGDELIAAFGYRLGSITSIGQRHSYPLALHQPQHIIQNRVILIGNAAHTLHPIAGQGFNLGLRGVATLLDCVTTRTPDAGINVAADGDLQAKIAAFSRAHQADWAYTMQATDNLVKLFSNDWIPAILIRNKAMSLIDKFPFVKAQLSHAAMGFRAHNSRLVSGLYQLTGGENN